MNEVFLAKGAPLALGSNHSGSTLKDGTIYDAVTVITLISLLWRKRKRYKSASVKINVSLDFIRQQTPFFLSKRQPSVEITLSGFDIKITVKLYPNIENYRWKHHVLDRFYREQNYWGQIQGEGFLT